MSHDFDIDFVFTRLPASHPLAANRTVERLDYSPPPFPEVREAASKEKAIRAAMCNFKLSEHKTFLTGATITKKESEDNNEKLSATSSPAKC